MFHYGGKRKREITRYPREEEAELQRALQDIAEYDAQEEEDFDEEIMVERVTEAESSMENALGMDDALQALAEVQEPPVQRWQRLEAEDQYRSLRDGEAAEASADSTRSIGPHVNGPAVHQAEAQGQAESGDESSDETGDEDEVGDAAAAEAPPEAARGGVPCDEDDDDDDYNVRIMHEEIDHYRNICGGGGSCSE